MQYMNVHVSLLIHNVSYVLYKLVLCVQIGMEIPKIQHKLICTSTVHYIHSIIFTISFILNL